MRTVAMVLQPGNNAFDVGVVVEVWGKDRTEHGLPAFELRRCAATLDPVELEGGLLAKPTHTMAGLVGADLVVVPGRLDWFGAVDKRVAEALRSAVRADATVAGLCSGAATLAAAGLLDGRRATTHWLLADRLAADFPRVSVETDALFVGDGPLWTSAGTAAGIDLCLHLVRQAHGSAAAATVARRMVTPPHRDGGQRQYVDTPVPARTAAPTIAAVQEWARDRLDHPLAVADLAGRAGVSERTFARRFVAEIGLPPLRWLLGERVHRAAELLERSDLSVDRVATRCGFADAGVLRTHFRRQLGTTPAAYRRTFGE
ncbi:GlxA family transcriptional regulator [Fodinicola acaciae]|uniref:GlxA family transcriptional regulator n=1 Tax=Fodinicola acaciae TaxID=2681555 RepID=UPI0013D7BC6D|nr:helix-turn-helix domain-containing protein [Fodinicola acaciae]